MKTVCEYCNKEINKTPFQLKRDKHNFCSKECFLKWKRKNPTAYSKKKGKNIICPVCGKEFYIRPGYKYKNPTCSYKCAWVFKRKEKKELTCFNCGKKYFVYPSVAKWQKAFNRKHTFCSAKCFYEYNKGKNCYQWIKDRTKLKIRPRHIKYQNWVESVFKRDDFTCVLCHSTKKPIEAHHIKKWESFPLLRYKTSNGVSLCFDCHQKTKGKEKKFISIFTKYIRNKK